MAAELMFCEFTMTMDPTLYIKEMKVWTTKWQSLHRMTALELLIAMLIYYDT
jgi:hypothetical protein